MADAAREGPATAVVVVAMVAATAGARTGTVVVISGGYGEANALCCAVVLCELAAAVGALMVSRACMLRDAWAVGAVDAMLSPPDELTVGGRGTAGRQGQ